MQRDLTKTPYNSIYATLKSANSDEEGVVLCCVHGNGCPYGRKVEETKNGSSDQYVNLASTSPKNTKKEKAVAQELTAKLNKLANEEPPRKPELMSLSSLMAETRKLSKSSRGGGGGVGSGVGDKRKKKHSLVDDDNQSYVMLGPASEVSGFATAPPPTEVRHKKPVESVHKASEALSAYIGVAELSDAETRVTRRGEFALYHLFAKGKQLDTLSEGLPLMLIYRTTTKRCRHYPVRVTSDNQFFVDCGYPNVRKHFSLNHLVTYYKKSATVELNPDDMSADSFSWWLE